MGFIAKTIGIIAFIFLYIKGEPAPPILGWLGFFIFIDFICTSALKKNLRQHGFYHNTPVTKSWIVIGLISEILVVILSTYVFIKL